MCFIILNFLYNYLGVILGMNIDVYNYLVNKLLSSNAFYHVNGTPEKRLLRIQEYAWYLYNNMGTEEFEILLQRVEINKRKNKKN